MKSATEMIEMISGFAEKQFKNTGRIARMYHAFKADGTSFVMPGPPGNKNVSVAAVRAVFAGEDVVGYVMVDEAWTLKRGLSEEEMEAWYATHNSLEGHPDRREVVIITAEDQNGQTIAMRDIIRPEHGKAKLGPLEYFTKPGAGGGLSGRMTGLLPQRGTVQ